MNDPIGPNRAKRLRLAAALALVGVAVGLIGVWIGNYWIGMVGYNTAAAGAIGYYSNKYLFRTEHPQGPPPWAWKFFAALGLVGGFLIIASLAGPSRGVVWFGTLFLMMSAVGLFVSLRKRTNRV